MSCEDWSQRVDQLICLMSAGTNSRRTENTEFSVSGFVQALIWGNDWYWFCLCLKSNCNDSNWLSWRHLLHVRLEIDVEVWHRLKKKTCVLNKSPQKKFYCLTQMFDALVVLMILSEDLNSKEGEEGICNQEKWSRLKHLIHISSEIWFSSFSHDQPVTEKAPNQWKWEGSCFHVFWKISASSADEKKNLARIWRIWAPLGQPAPAPKHLFNIGSDQDSQVGVKDISYLILSYIIII